MKKRKEIHERVLKAKSKEELMAAYGEWADHYDTDLMDELGYVAPVLTGKLLQEHLETREARILDAGCGTGLVGEVLRQDGYSNIEGLDYSADMLDRAAGKDIYGDLIQGDLTDTLDIKDNQYDAVISVGTFTCGHVGPEALEELVRITRPGGHICFTVREQAWQEQDYQEILQDLEENGVWEKQERRTAPYIEKEGSSCIICLYQVAA